MKRFTVFCKDANDEHPTTHIDAVDAIDVDDAVALGRRNCAADWDANEDEVKVIGVAEGDVRILAWDDEEGLH